MKNIISVVCLLFLFACEDKETKFVKAEFAKVLGKWTIDKVILPTNAPAALQNKIKTAEIFFEDGCQYDAKKFAKTNQACGGGIDVNSKIFSFSYIYLYGKQQYQWDIGVFENSDVLTRDVYLYASQIFDGNWEVVVDGNTLTAKRKGVEKPYPIPDIFYQGDVTFTAIRKQ
jgi:hypothetical protein